MSEAERVSKRRAIEALRAGVPNRDAVLALGSTQPQIEGRFREQLQSIAHQPEGMLVQGGFGAGKSHLLEFLRQTALKENYVCSKVVISKETPFYDPVKLYRGAAEAAVVPGRSGDALTEIMTQMNPNSQAYADFYQWVNNSSDLSQMFAATLFIYERMPGTHNGEERNRILRFWSGEKKINRTEIRRWLREGGEKATYNLAHVPEKELAMQRFKFAPRLMKAAGYAGWLLFIDEVELTGRYSLLQRAKSYIELARFLGRLEDWQSPGLLAIGFITDDFAHEILKEKNDLENVPGRLRARGLGDNLLWASQAERGMRVIDREALPLASPDEAMLQAVYDKVKSIYAAAYDWTPPDVRGVERTITTRMRHYVKGWITEWDLRRMHPDSEPPEIEADSLTLDYSEDKDLQVPPEDDAED